MNNKKDIHILHFVLELTTYVVIRKQQDNRIVRVLYISDKNPDIAKI